MEANDSFDYARAHAKADCQKCHGTGTYMYDKDHGTICNLCCDHGRGWWLLKEHYGVNNDKWCCVAGCGHILEKLNDQQTALIAANPEINRLPA